ncbi:Cys-Gln thioester bond-forming surface protein [Listeria welshimeri]|uniref:SpaA isopeptide-forming pilin-related protein n=1 Tax=Listeria TaxID=1637 RepID=UPI00086AE2DA|nr:MULTISPECIES: SpaA isopeptide-forming pilin-related protein [Listeria]EAC8292098.1 LPXTG cell wall anchor domain-containing protein [Listeria monocytogenes]EAD1488715.1 LPXTG cell wall anchor domain-containing protein [Listeria monocytogenes]EAF9811562.1 LPXTG cell wall anchor domain-containing protein [Listeria monocytogenes]EEO6738012.1 Cys-Gln thioester bond-forming surface protein [Listeria monocytogenes]MBF2703839.1 Cys-Gln thioester bond-forming surface protein [Listeria welshimeri]
MKIKRIKWRPFIAIMAVIFVVAQTLIPPLNALAKSTEESNKMYKVGQTKSGLVIQSSMNPIKNLKSSGNSSGEMSAWYGGYETKTAFITVNGVPSFCIEPSKNYPVNKTYAESVYHDEGIMNIMYYGYPNNGTSEKNYVDTYVALNYYLGNFDSPDMANDSGVKYLLDKAKAKTAPIGKFNISNKDQTATWNASTKRQETGWYQTNYQSIGGANYYTLPLPTGVSAVTSDGKIYTGNTRIEAGKDFKLVADATFDKTVTLDVPTDVREKSALKFTPNDSSVQKLMNAGGFLDPITIQNVTARFTAQTGDGVIVKKDKDSRKTLSGAQYHVTGDDFDKTVTTGSDGKVNLNDLIVGNYKVVETKAPAGYTIDSTAKTLTIKAKETTTLNVNNKEAFFQVKLTKEDAETGAKTQGAATLKGAEYTLYADSALNKPLQTVSIGDDNTATSQKFSFENKTERTIYAKETKAPGGYNIDTTVYPIKATQDNQTTEVFLETATSKDKVIKGSVDLVKFADTPLINDPLNPLPSGQKMPLVGAEFTLTSDTTGEVVATMGTDENGRAHQDNLVYDMYTVHESVTPEGYKAVEDFKIKIDTEGKTYYYTLEDTAKRSEIKIVKKDATTGKVIPVAGVEFQILDVNGNVITQDINYPMPLMLDTFATADDGTLVLPSSLTFGDYYLKEIKAPNGYTLNKELIPFTVDGSQELVTVECENTPQMGKIVLDKFGETVDNDKTTTNKLVYKETLLPNTEYDVIAKNDIKTADGTTRAKKSEVVDHVKTDAKGHAQTKELFLGVYTLHETKAPVDYTLGADKDVSLKYAGQEVKVTSTSVDLHNKLVKSDVVITKKGSDGKKLAGVEFSLYDSHGKLIMTGTTDKNGQLTFKNVPYATAGYSVKETKGIDGYKMDTTAQKVSIEKDGESILLTFVNEKIPAKPLPKTGDKTNTGTLVGGGILVLGGLTGLFATAYLNRKKKA